MYQQSVPALISKNVGNTLTNYKTWGGILYNVKDQAYGAKGDGVTDDTAAINNAISNIPSTGGVLFFPVGTYIISQKVSITKSNVTLMGFGPSSIIKSKQGIDASVDKLIQFQNQKNILIDNITFDGNASNQTGTKNTFLLWFDQCENVDVTNCAFQNGYGDMFVVNNCRKVFIDNNLFDTTVSGASRDYMGLLIYADNLAWADSRSVVSNNIFKDITFDALTISGQRGVSVRISYVSVTGNQFINCGHMLFDSLDPNQDASSIYLQDCDYVSVVGNIVDQTWGNGIDSLYGSNLTISGNIVTRSGNAGVSIEQCSNVTITGNEIANNETKGATTLNVNNGLLSAITVKTNSIHVIISNNILTDNQDVKTQEYAVYLFGTGLSNIHVTDNYMFGNKTGTIYWQNLDVSYRFLRNEGFNQQGFGTPTPALPTGAGLSVRNLNPFPVTVYYAGGAGVSMQDAGGQVRENIPGNPPAIQLEPFDFIYFKTTVPTSWLWYGH